jgi:RimJ/RimL family protein N-acetyltransferase
MTSSVNPLLLDFPDCFDTERLHLRAPRPGDGVVVNAAVRESLDELRLWMPWAHVEQDLAESESVMRRMAAAFIKREDLMLLLFRKSDGLFLGGSGLHRIDWSVPRFEIGYWLRTSMTGQGYMTEAVNGITAFAFDTLKAERVEIRCDANNRRSAAVAERAGYALEARLRHDARATDGSLRDTLIFAKIRQSPA